MNGDMIGMNTAILSASGTSSGVGFAIPAALVKRVVETAAVRRPARRCGRGSACKTQEVTAEIARSPRPGPARRACWSPTSMPGGPARAGGAEAGRPDRLDRRPAGERRGGAELPRSPTRGPGDEVSLAVRKAGRRDADRARARLPRRRAAPARTRTITGRNPLDGATVIEPLAGRGRRAGPGSVRRRRGRAGHQGRRRRRGRHRPAAGRLHPQVNGARLATRCASWRRPWPPAPAAPGGW